MTPAEAHDAVVALAIFLAILLGLLALMVHE